MSIVHKHVRPSEFKLNEIEIVMPTNLSVAAPPILSLSLSLLPVTPHPGAVHAKMQTL